MMKMTCNMTFSVIWHCCNWHQDHLIPMALSNVPLHSLCENNWNNVEYIFLVMWYHWCWYQSTMMPKSVINHTIPFLKSRWWKGNITWHFWSHNASAQALCDFNGTNALHRSTCLKWRTTWLFWLCNAIDACTSIPCHWMLSMAPLHFLAQDDWKELQHTCFGNVPPLAPAMA